MRSFLIICWTQRRASFDAPRIPGKDEQLFTRYRYPELDKGRCAMNGDWGHFLDPSKHQFLADYYEARTAGTAATIEYLAKTPGKTNVSINPIVRCAIYCRKSTDDGLEREFNSLDAQREACEAYITSQRHEGWIILPDVYSDGGFTGANTDRPALKRLLDDIHAGKIDAVVTYKVDRLSRSLLDFARLMELFEENGVSFASVTQDFSTTTAIGKLTLNILMSFAEFERAIIAERVRDKIAASKRKGQVHGRHSDPRL